MQRSHFAFLFVLAAASACTGSAFALGPVVPVFQPLGDLPGGDFHSEGWYVSGDGNTVVGVGNSAAGTEAYRWTAGGGMVGLGNLPGKSGSFANATSADASVIVGWSGNEAFRWTA